MNTQKLFYYAGLLIGFMLYAATSRVRSFKDEIKLDNKESVRRKLYDLVPRYFRFSCWNLLEGGAFIILPPDERLNEIKANENPWLEPKKRVYLLALQIENYEKKKIRKYDFMTFDEKENFEVV